MKILLIALASMMLMGCSDASNQKMKETQGPTLGEKVIGEVTDKSTTGLDKMGDIVDNIDINIP